LSKFSRRINNNTNSNNVRTLFLLGLGLTADGTQGTANLFQNSNQGVRSAAMRNNMPTSAIDRIMGKTSKIAKGAKWTGRSVVGLGSAISVYQIYDCYSRGDITGAHKAGADLGVGILAASIGGIPGLVLYGGYMLITQPNLHYVPYYPDMNTFPNDNTNVSIPLLNINR